MPSVQRFLSGRHNLARTAALVASSVRASRAIERVHAQRTGGGRVRLAGDYIGHEAADVQVRISATGGVPRASVPQFVGVGNGGLQVLAVDAAAPLQGITLTLADLGVATAHALLDVREVQLRARAPGAVGNSIRVSVEPRLVRTPTAWALLADWPAGTAVQTGPQWDFGGLPLNAQQELDAASPRIQFGSDPQVYRPWRRFKDGAWQFGLSPALERNVPAGTPVLAVTGGYVVTVTDGVASETFGDVDAAQPAIESFHDLLLALADSALVEVAGVVAADRTVGGQAAIDVPLRTQAWLLALGGKVALAGVAVPPGAPTQAVTLRCINDDVVGAERWSVAGDVSGTLPVATTGVPYASAAALFTVPRIDPAAAGSGRWSFKFRPAAREAGEGVPSICLRPFRLGRNAVPRTVTFTYTKRPPADCKCSDMPTPRLSLACLGLTEEAALIDAEYQSRLEALYKWRSDFTEGNSGLPSVDDDIHGVDVTLANRVTAVLAQGLTDLFAAPPAVAAALTEWDAALVALKADLASLETATGVDDDLYEKALVLRENGNLAIRYVDQYAARYEARMDYVRTLAGIVPKSESSSSDAGSCWTDHGGTHWWVDAEGYYLPAFTNQAYVSARRDTDTGRAYSTQEFGFGLVVACPERLREGDEITLRIEAVDGERPYRVGDEAIIQTIGAGPAWLAGGVDGTDVQTWRVLGGASGALPDYVVPTDGAPVPDYAAAGITLRMAPGGIPFSLGDTFTLAVEAGQYQWRQDGGAWSAEADIPADGQALLADGLTVHFDAGAAPSFVPGDDYVFRVHQPWATSHVRDAQASAWGWDGSNATLEIDLGAVQPLGALALARYTLPAGAVLAFELSDDGAGWTAPVALDTSGPACVHLLDAAARHLRLTVAGAEGGHIGWLWVGVPLATDHHASSCQRRRRWAARRGDGPNAASLYSGVGDGWSLAWEPGDAQSSRLLAADVAQLVGLLDWAQAHDEPLLFVPHHQHPQDAALVRFAADALEVTDLHAWQPDSAGDRILSAALELDPVYA
ncbi:hypothetical protein H0I39_02055 [Ottowia beijingensis]|uniref:Uncharacterized protein n=1 Tax=Ottowia beijingensis TaxID=1207057 RepID=A0A853IKQ5_9BURK|nr:hypothetical protein [Ottowia beijingensis]NZA00872.1 hypothetical protein [Ottowia beijingensis]